MKHNLFSFLRRGLQIRRNFSTTCTTLGTRGEKLQADAALCGRSMVEMLGVLAIIGILSVGAIAGYSKAMMKYKLNKQAEQISTLVNAGLRYAGQWHFSQDTHLVPYLIKLNEVPKEMIHNSSVNSLYDIFGTNISIYYTINNNNQHYTQFFIYLNTANNDDYALSICRNLVNISKEFHANLWTVEMLNQKDDGNFDAYTYYGDAYCTGSRRCLKNITVEETETFCRYNLGKTGNPHFKLRWME